MVWAGKLFLLDPADDHTHQIFFDDNLGFDNYLETGRLIVDLRNPRTCHAACVVQRAPGFLAPTSARDRGSHAPCVCVWGGEDVGTGEPLDAVRYRDVYLVEASIYHAIHDRDYFVRCVEQCERNLDAMRDAVAVAVAGTE